MQPIDPIQQPTQQPTLMQDAIKQQNQPQQSTPPIDPELSQSIIDNLKSQSQQIEQAQTQIAENNDIQAQ